MKYLITILVFMANISLAYSDDFPGVEQLMTEQEYRASGLHKLNRDELAELNRWLIRYTANDAPTMHKMVKHKEVDLIRSQIDGMFYGWRGKTKFKLKNGQIWQQRYPEKWEKELFEPEILIRKNLLGLYDLEIVSEKRKIGVKRIK